jgi:hypothetical protein
MFDFSDTELAIAGMTLVGIISLICLDTTNSAKVIHDILLVLGGVVSGKTIRKQ